MPKIVTPDHDLPLDEFGCPTHTDDEAIAVLDAYGSAYCVVENESGKKTLYSAPVMADTDLPEVSDDAMIAWGEVTHPGEAYEGKDYYESTQIFLNTINATFKTDFTPEDFAVHKGPNPRGKQQSHSMDGP